jgi:hypothetical protein
MARWTHIQGPAGDFNPGAAFSVIPGFTVNRHFQGGIILLMGTILYQNNAAGNAFFNFEWFIDGVQFVRAFQRRHFVPAGDEHTIAFHDITTLTTGRHIIELQVFDSTNPTAVKVDRACMTIVELPEWDDLSQLILL